jgi:precorrin-8X/cobalt-precorrin-8 methylmutase
MVSSFIHVEPADIEATSMALIDAELEHPLPPDRAPIIKRVIHTTADFSYADTLVFSDDAIRSGHDALRAGCTVVTDTMMAQSGINKAALTRLGGSTRCFMSDPLTAALAKKHGTTRATASMDLAAQLADPVILAVGNAPTALVRAHALIESGAFAPALIIGVPVGFVNVVPAKELIIESGIPHIVNRGRKGGSNVAAAIVNALMYQLISGSARGWPTGSGR